MWWRDNAFMTEALMSIMDFDKNGLLGLEEIRPALDHMIRPEDVDSVYMEYASAAGVGLTFDEVTYILADWAIDELKGVDPQKPYWYDWHESKLYGGMHPELWKHISKADID